LKHERVTEEARELAALHALGALTQHEARSFEIHLQEGCPVCEAELRRFEHTVTSMGFAAEEFPSPEYMRDILMVRIEREVQTAPLKIQTESQNTEKAPDEPRFKRPAREIFTQPEHKRRSVFPWLLAAAFAVLAILVFLAWMASRKDVIRLQSEISTAQAGTDNLHRELNLHQTKNENLEKILAMAGTQGVRIVHLKGEPATPANSGTILWDPKQGQCIVLGSFIPAPSGKVYQLWFSSLTVKVSIGLLNTDTNGRIFMILSSPKDIDNVASAIVTLEPSQGSPAPTGPFCATGRID
jgi:anti-sigma-K factor RskA